MTANLIFGLLFAGCVLVSLWLAVRALQRLGRNEPLLPFEPRRAVPWGLFDLGLAMMLLLLGQAFAAQLVAQRLGVPPGSDLATTPPGARAAILFAGSVASLLAVGVSATLIIWRSGGRLVDFGWRTDRLWQDVKLGVAAFLLLAPPVYGLQMILVQWFPSEHPLIRLLQDDPDPLFFLLTSIAAVVIAPVAEEYLFRGLLQGWLEKIELGSAPAQELILGERQVEAEPRSVAKPSGENRAGAPGASSGTRPSGASENPYEAPAPGAAAETAADAGPEQRSPAKWPIVLSALLFAAAHYSHGPDPIPLFLLALGLGYLYQRTHRILPSIIVHLLLNACSMGMLVWSVVAS